jgi:prolyl-tRNA editing enzyme YbaK/EbsC (Cys-tRNA(Pro) deacylase)
MSTLENESVKKVRAALIESGVGDNVIELEETARSAEEAAKSVGVELGSIVKSLVFLVDEQPVMALVAGDHTCMPDALPRALNLEGEVKQCDADQVRAATGFAIGGVAPVALAQDLPTLLDVSLKRFDTVYAAAGHPNCVFTTSVSDLKRLTGCIVSYAIAEPA